LSGAAVSFGAFRTLGRLCGRVVKGPFLTLGALKGPFLTFGVLKGPFSTLAAGVSRARVELASALSVS
jgi:hypothetical protein